MKNQFKILMVCFIATMLTSCGFLRPMTSNQNQVQTNVVLQSDNYHIVGTVQGTVSCTYIFGIGGLSKKALYTNAHADMIKKANLKGSQALINVSSQERVSSIVGIYSKIQVVTTGTIIEFDNK